MSENFSHINCIHMSAFNEQSEFSTNTSAFFSSDRTSVCVFAFGIFWYIFRLSYLPGCKNVGQKVIICSFPVCKISIFMIDISKKSSLISPTKIRIKKFNNSQHVLFNEEVSVV